MSIVLSPWSELEAPEPHWRRLSVPCGFLDRADAAAAQGDITAAAHFFRLADNRIDEAIALAAAVNAMPADGMTRLREIARRLADGGPEPTRGGHAIEFRCAEDGDEISVWLTIGRTGAEDNALLGALIGQ